MSNETTDEISDVAGMRYVSKRNYIYADIGQADGRGSTHAFRNGTGSGSGDNGSCGWYDGSGFGCGYGCGDGGWSDGSGLEDGTGGNR